MRVGIKHQNGDRPGPAVARLLGGRETGIFDTITRLKDTAVVETSLDGFAGGSSHCFGLLDHDDDVIHNHDDDNEL